MRRSPPPLLAAAAFLSAFSVTHNFYGATSLAIFFTLAVWAAWLANPGWSVIGRAVAIAALAYGLCAFWLTPSYLRITMQDLHWVSEPASRPWPIAAAAAMLAVFVLSYSFTKGHPGAMWAVFITGSTTLLGFYVLPFFYFGAAVVGNPGRLLPEFDLSCIFVFAAVVSCIFRIPKLRPVAVPALLLPSPPARK